MSPFVVNRHADFTDDPNGTWQLTSMRRTHRYACTVHFSEAMPGRPFGKTPGDTTVMNLDEFLQLKDYVVDES